MHMRFTFLFLAGSLVATVLHAQQADSLLAHRLSVTLSGGGGIRGLYAPQAVPNYAHFENHPSAVAFAATGEWSFTPRFSVVGRFGFGNTSDFQLYTDYNEEYTGNVKTVTSESRTYSHRINNVLFSAGGKYYLDHGRYRPYISLELAAIHNSVREKTGYDYETYDRYDSVSTETISSLSDRHYSVTDYQPYWSMGMQGGFGLEFSPKKHFTIHLEVSSGVFYTISDGHYKTQETYDRSQTYHNSPDYTEHSSNVSIGEYGEYRGTNWLSPVERLGIGWRF